MVQPTGKKLILDLDTGIDDALAIAYALGSPEADLIGITGTYGNVLVEQGVSNALAILDLFGRPDIPVYSGLPHSSTAESFSVLPISAFIHGKNGIGEAQIPHSPCGMPSPQMQLISLLNLPTAMVKTLFMSLQGL